MMGIRKQYSQSWVLLVRMIGQKMTVRSIIQLQLTNE